MAANTASAPGRPGRSPSVTGGRPRTPPAPSGEEPGRDGSTSPPEAPGCCPHCGAPRLVPLGTTGHSLVRQCEVCRHVVLEPR
jgi:hypothetical protein